MANYPIPFSEPSDYIIAYGDDACYISVIQADYDAGQSTSQVDFKLRVTIRNDQAGYSGYFYGESDFDIIDFQVITYRILADGSCSVIDVITGTTDANYAFQYQFSNSNCNIGYVNSSSWLNFVSYNGVGFTQGSGNSFTWGDSTAILDAVADCYNQLYLLYQPVDSAAQDLDEINSNVSSILDLLNSVLSADSDSLQDLNESLQDAQTSIDSLGVSESDYLDSLTLYYTQQTSYFNSFSDYLNQTYSADSSPWNAFNNFWLQIPLLVALITAAICALLRHDYQRG